MDADRWRQIETLYAVAQALTAEERSAYLAANCAGDDLLRLDVESLLEASPAVHTGSALASVASALSADQVSTHTHVAAQGSEVRFGSPGSRIGRFVIHERLGVGGMGEVFRAADTQLKRTVAIKRLVHGPDDQSPGSRLLKEAQRASALNHPRIASVYDVFTMGSELLLVMEYIDGITLRERIKRPIPVSDFYAMARQCTEALSAAHEKGILHGDIKPANIMLTRDGQVKVCDFGLARRLASGGSADSLTTRQGIVGTPAYMPPEVILEQPIDEHADIFSLGVVFYEMLARRNPFTGDSIMATVDRVLNHSPEPLDRINPEVPGTLARVIHRMLEKDPHDRQGSVAAVGEALASLEAQRSATQHRRHLVRRVRAAAALTAVAILLVFTVPRMANPPTGSSAVPLPQPINLAVLPFAVAGTTGDRQYFGEGLTESVNEQLAKLMVTNRTFQVASVTDRRARRVTNPVEARGQLGANLALSGLLQYDGPDVRVTALLFDTRSGRQLRTDTFTAPVANAPAIQAGALDMVVRMLGLTLDPQQRALLGVDATTRPGAYEYYLRARGYLLDYDRIESIEAAIKVFRSALQIDSRYAPAYAGLGQAYWRKHELTGASEWTELAQANCETALDIDRGLAESHVCLGMVLNGTGEYERAGAEYSLALKSDPTNDQAYIGLAWAYDKLGRQADAEETYRRAIRLRPHYWGGYNNLGAYYYNTARFQDALTAFTQVVELAPDSFRGHSSVGAVEFKLEHTDEAIAAFMTSLRIRPNYVAASNLATLYYFEGQFDLAADYFNQALKLDRGSYQVWNNLAEALEQLGRHEGAVNAFRQARLLAKERLQVNPNDAGIQVVVADASAALGEMDAAREALSAALRLAPTEANTLFLLGVFYEARLKDRDEALKWLAKAIAHGQTWREIDKLPALRRLRDDPRFQQLRHPN